MKDRLIVRGARQHNLKNLDLDIPRRALTVITGPSGSGKSSLAFDTIYAEGQRRYVESLSAYARQFLERMEKPNVDIVDGLSPAVAIEQKNPTKTSRSTVGTATEIYDYLRLLWARIGHTFCSVCGRELRPSTVQSVTDAVLTFSAGTRFAVAFPLRVSDQVSHAVVVENLQARGFVRVSVGGVTRQLDELSTAHVDLTTAVNPLVIVDRLVVGPEVQSRLADAVGTAFAEGDGDCVILVGDIEHRFTERFECPNDGTVAPEPTPQLFSFNNPRGACPTCNGFGAVLEYDESLIVPDPSKTLSEGAIDPWEKPRYDNTRRTLADFARKEKIPLNVPWRDLTPEQRQVLLHAAVGGKTKPYVGIFPFLKRLEAKRYKQYIRVFLRQYQSAKGCPSCHGAKLQPAALHVRIADRNIAEVAELPVEALQSWLDVLPLTPFEQTIATAVLREARDRVQFLVDVGLGYLSLNRAARTLSGGEAQRIALANSLGSHLVDTLYVLDEPSIGLHPRDIDRLLRLLTRLRDTGNTVLVVEHDLEAVRHADYMVELGPGSGDAGGRIVFAGPIAKVADSPLTGEYLTGLRTIPIPDRRPVGPPWLTLTGARQHNLQGVDVRIPIGAMTVVTGVSGSGKSTLVHDVLYRALETRLRGDHSAKRHLGEPVGGYASLTGAEAFTDVVLIDQDPIGRSPRSNPVTYIKAYDEIRRLFAETALARQRRYTPGTFSFNVPGGRCENCEGAGYIEVEMVFMADVFVPCDVCGGRRFKSDVLEVTVKNKNIAQVLDLTVEEAVRFFHGEDRLTSTLWQLQRVGLGYLHLGQPATTLSGGEAQRIKIARELAASARSGGRKLYILDEPTTGLHLEDIRRLANVLDRLVDQGHTLVLIEHNLDVIKLADWVIDLGPEAGMHGGRVVAMGRPEDVAAVEASHTGRWLRTVLPRPSKPVDTGRFAMTLDTL
ncbi:MAG TPA: excinuclease ABC subunit UvrA [Gemmatimonadaceae bacterium]|nr:excinuclease ABC subunit UvrA [Gemmatimonadaceae bacterium]